MRLLLSCTGFGYSGNVIVLMLIVLHSSNNIDFANHRPKMDTELNSKIIKEKYRFFVPIKIMYRFRIDKETIDKAKKEAKKLSLCASAFIRQAIIDKVNHRNKLKDLEKRIGKLENLK